MIRVEVQPIFIPPSPKLSKWERPQYFFKNIRFIRGLFLLFQGYFVLLWVALPEHPICL
jgi:hypothetical protein